MEASVNTAQVMKLLTPTLCEQVHSGVDKDQRPYTIYKVEAIDEAGNPVDADLRSFVELELDVEGLFEVLRYERHGRTSFTLKPRKKLGDNPPEGRPDVGEMEARISRLESKVTWLYEQVERALRLAGDAAAGPEMGAPDPPLDQDGSRT